jgi:hypothetical protein
VLVPQKLDVRLGKREAGALDKLPRASWQLALVRLHPAAGLDDCCGDTVPFLRCPAACLTLRL